MAEQTEYSSLGSLPADCHPRVAALHAYWESIRPAPDLLPGRQHFDPVDVPHLLRWIWLVDVLRDPVRFRYRLTGTSFIGAMGGDYTGRFVGEADPVFFAQTWGRHYVAAVNDRTIGYFRGRPIIYTDRNHVWMERLLMPMAQDGKTVDMLLGITIYEQIARSLF